jgi:leader peptidase (prepilin peptidase)/N-methyltransferase
VVSAPFLLLCALFGLVLGSFATCAGHRLAHGGSILTPARSYCPACRTPLTWRENIPLLGWLMLRGRCRFCGTAIPARYPLTELASGVFALLAGLTFGPTPHLLAALAFATLFLVLSLIDLETMLLPDALTLSGALAALACSALLPRLWTLGIGWQASLLGAGLGGGGIWLIAWLYRRIRGMDGMGLGDAKLMLLVGALLGPLAVPVTLVLGAVFALPFGLAAARRNAGAEAEDDENDEGDDERVGGYGLLTAVPFGPFLCAAALLHLLAGPYLLHWWLGLPLP